MESFPDLNSAYLEEDIVTSETPLFIADVTTSVRFNLDEKGIKLMGKTKANIMGFFNPIPTFKREHEYPVLCVVYKRPSIDNETSIVDYYKDNDNVSIEIE